ncbi:hypothetical protein HDU86_006411 [Geranomyces michiganensis]|nr:hypothetical protein HDU86_006411 [Geranomyces michiganensis]
MPSAATATATATAAPASVSSSSSRVVSAAYVLASLSPQVPPAAHPPTYPWATPSQLARTSVRIEREGSIEDQPMLSPPPPPRRVYVVEAGDQRLPSLCWEGAGR